MRYGYARVSTEDQSLEIQVEDLRRNGCADIRQEKISGSNAENRPEFVKLLADLKPGDELWVVRIDRFARSVRDLANIVADFQSRGIFLKATQQPIDTTSASGRCFLQMLAVFAEFERSITAERRAAGIAKAKTEGKYIRCGRPKSERSKTFDPIVARELKEMVGARRAAEQMGVSRQMFYRAIGGVE